jgi:hypothetical protein
VPQVTVGILVDYESPLARRVAGDIWAGLSRTALESGFTKTTALWTSLTETESSTTPEGPLLNVFAIGQDRPEAIEAVRALGGRASARLYGLVVAVPDRSSPLAGSLLYQGVERLGGSGVRAGMVEPALLHAVPEECERYARRLLERLRTP